MLTALAFFFLAPIIGRISGGEFSVSGQVEFGADGSATLRSGAVLEMRSGVARLSIGDGEARFCAPLKATLLKANDGDPTMLVALELGDQGAFEFDYMGSAAHTVQTAFFSVGAVPVAEPAQRRLAVRTTATGDACVAALAGTLRVREQFGPSELLVPPGKAMLAPATGVDAAVPVDLAACSCGAPPLQLPRTNAGTPAPETKSSIATAPLVYEADSRDQTSAVKEPEITLPVVVADNSGRVSEQPAPASRPPDGAEPRRRGFMGRLKGFFRAVFGSR